MTLKIGNAQGFWGDDPDAPARLVSQQSDLDYVTMDYLAEVSLSIMAAQRERKPELGYPPAALRKDGCKGLRIGIVSGDDILERMRRLIREGSSVDLMRNLETGEGIDRISERLVTANADLGVDGIVRALESGADIVLTGRVTDSSLVCAPCVHHYGWKTTEYDKLAGGLVAAHMIECGVQVSGGISTDWLEVPSPAGLGFPLVDVVQEGRFVVTYPDGTGGCFLDQKDFEQLLFEFVDHVR
ncbi:MAG: DUF1446 domain-containing protein [Acidobacteriota bacterium]